MADSKKSWSLFSNYSGTPKSPSPDETHSIICSPPCEKAPDEIFRKIASIEARQIKLEELLEKLVASQLSIIEFLKGDIHKNTSK